MWNCFQRVVTERTGRAVSIDIHFVAHVPTRGYSVDKFVLKLDQFIVIC